MQQFQLWNPGIGSDCLGVWLDSWYRIGLNEHTMAVPDMQTQKQSPATPS
ncbi:hypothetical protein GQ43DRAFT_490878 [Delitschia confertaspora ATCC 74209]|uniref:Uncharacterized protein n=1 Tax=Delitschia confertaspora ATCC 74209 TaxID=1513339 RepID=A0A9P4JI25_9PLEO|nr:hypothetical protein GQ43DRAFT_490878 [Delitschia confertaspora ATCC 74209]